MRVLLTGATGYLGRHIAARLAALEIDAVGLSRNDKASTAIPLVTGDVLDPDSMRRASQGCNAVIHAAGLVSHDPADAALLRDVHVNGTINTLSAAAEAGVQRVVYLSSSGTVAVSEDERPRTETSPVPAALIARWPYYRSKLYAEQEALARSTAAMPVVSLNPSLLLGPGDPTGASTRAVSLFLRGKVAAVPPGGVSFADVRDVADATISALTRGEGGQRYLLGAVNWGWGEFYGRLARASDRSAPVPRLPALTRKAIDWLPAAAMRRLDRFTAITAEELDLSCHFWYLDDRRAREALGWAPRDPGLTLRDTVTDLGF